MYAKNIRLFGIALAMVGLTAVLGYGVRRSEFVCLLGGYAAFFALYVWLAFGAALSASQWRFFIALGIFLRVLLLFSIPNLSDDVFRFIWDGRLIANGIHPFAHPPIWFSTQQCWPEGLTPALLGRLNSPEYYTVYPPVCQGVFALAAWVSPHGLLGAVVCLKGFLLLCELGSIWILYRNRTEETRLSGTLLYALNPLLILEVSGNCHFEGAAIFFLLAALQALRGGPDAETAEKKPMLSWSAVFLALSTATKLVPLLFVPLVWRWLGWKKGSQFVLVYALAMVALFLPLLDIGLLRNMAQSLDLYFQKFAFNASVYYVLWEIGLYFKNYNMVNTLGPAVGCLQMALMALVFVRLKPGGAFASLHSAMVGVLCLYLFGASTVHPWYVALLLGLVLAPVPDKKFSYLFALVWSGTVVLSYSHYQHGAFVEQKGLIALEYLLVLAAWLALDRRRDSSFGG